MNKELQNNNDDNLLPRRGGKGAGEKLLPIFEKQRCLPPQEPEPDDNVLLYVSRCFFQKYGICYWPLIRYF